MLRFSTDDFPPEKRVEAYREIYGRTIVRHEIRLMEGQPFRCVADLGGVPGLGLASTIASPCRRLHGPQHIDHDDLLLGMAVHGGCMLRQRGREASISTGEAVLCSGADPVTVDIPPVAQSQALPQSLSLRIPSAVFRPLIPGLHDRLPLRIARDDPSSSLLVGYIAAIRSSDALTVPALRERAVMHVHDIVALMLGAEGDVRHAADERGGRAVRRAAILGHIKKRHADPNLTANIVAALLGVTPRYVHLLLEETGQSFSHHLLERRLERAAELLRDPAWRGRRITDVASEAGFTDLSHFSRVFRRRFGGTPSDIRNASGDVKIDGRSNPQEP